MLVRLATALLSSGALLLIAARFSPEWGARREIWSGSGDDAQGGSQGRAERSGVGIFSQAVAIPAAMGFLGGNVLLVLGGFVGATMARSAAGPASGPDPGGRTDRRWVWFVIMSWSILGAAWSVDTFDLRRAVAAQAVLGPAALSHGALISGLLCLSFVAGLVSAFYWTGHLSGRAQSARSPAEASLRWGEAALAGSALTGAFFGPGLGAWLWAPAASGVPAASMASYLLTCAVVAAVSWSRRLGALPPAGVPRTVAGFSALAALAAVALA